MFRIHDILERIRILGSVHLAPDPDPSIFYNGLQDVNKKVPFKDSASPRTALNKEPVQ
jgi:hypothetical protein